MIQAYVHWRQGGEAPFAVAVPTAE